MAPMASVFLSDIPQVHCRISASANSHSSKAFVHTNCPRSLANRTAHQRSALRTHTAAAGVASAPYVLPPVSRPDATVDNESLPQVVGNSTVADVTDWSSLDGGEDLAALVSKSATEPSFNLLALTPTDTEPRNVCSGDVGILAPVSSDLCEHGVNQHQPETRSGHQRPTTETQCFEVGEGSKETGRGGSRDTKGTSRRSTVSLQDRVAHERQRQQTRDQGRLRDRKHTAVARALTFCLRGAQTVEDVVLIVQGSENLLSLGAVTSCLSKLGKEGHTLAVLAVLQWMRGGIDSSPAAVGTPHVSKSSPQARPSLVPNVYTYNAALGALRANREWGAMDQVLSWMQQDRVPLDAVTLNTYLAAYLGRGMDDVAWGVLARTAEHLRPEPDLFSVRTMARSAVLRKRRGAEKPSAAQEPDHDLSVLWGRLGLLLDLYRNNLPRTTEGSVLPCSGVSNEEVEGSSGLSHAQDMSEKHERSKQKSGAAIRQQQQLPEIEALLRRVCAEALREAVVFIQEHQKQRKNQRQRTTVHIVPESALHSSSLTALSPSAENAALEKSDTADVWEQGTESTYEQGSQNHSNQAEVERIWVKRALDLSDRMKGAGVRLDGSCYYWLLKALCQDPCAQQRQIRRVHAEMRDRRYLPDMSLCHAIITALGHAKQWWAALEVLEEMRRSGPQPKLETEALIRSQFNYLLNAGRKRRLWKWSLQLLERMQGAGVVPDAVSWRTVLVTCAAASETGAAVRVFREMVDAGHQADVVAYGALLSALEKGQQWAQADEVWSHMCKVEEMPNVQAYTTMMAGLGKQGQYGRALALFEEMCAQGVRADTPAYNALISACAYAGDGERALEWLNKMEAAGVLPNSTSFEQAALALRNQGDRGGALNLMARGAEQGLLVQTAPDKSLYVSCSEQPVDESWECVSSSDHELAVPWP